MTLLELLEHAFLAGGFTTKSDFARAEADLIAQASIVGFLTTQTPRDGFGSVWRLTPQGQIAMWESQPCECPNCEPDWDELNASPETKH
jgi:hypothetical protein